jgi:transcriptional repressor NF-X1
LTEGDPSHEQLQEEAYIPRKPDAKSDSLTSRLTHSLSVPPYADCPICFNAIHPDQPIWSCQPGPSSGV